MQHVRWQKERFQVLFGLLLFFIAVFQKNFRTWDQGRQTERIAGICQAAETSGPAKNERLSLHSRAAVLMDGDSGRVLYGKEETEVLPMASTTKIMTCILALEHANPDMEVPVSGRAASMPEVKLHMKKGETYRMEDLLYSLMLESHNDSAVAIAEAVGGSVEEFAAMMNQKAAEIGCTDTYFVTPNGLDAKEEESGKIHSTTAGDLAKILRYCIRISPAKEEFLAITRAPSHAFSDCSGARSFSCINHNALLTSMEGAVSGKTGFTGNAGYCYTGAVQRGDRLFIVALLGCGWPPHRTYKWQDVRTLIRYGEETFEYRTVKKQSPGQKKLPVENGVKEDVAIETLDGEKETFRVLLGKEEEVQVRTKIRTSVKAPVEAGTPVGQIDYEVGGMILMSDPIVTAERCEEWTFVYAGKQVTDRFWLP